MKICLVIPSLQPGGMERVMSELAWHFSSKAHVELHVVLYGIERGVFYPISDNITVHKPDFVFNDDRRLLSTIKTMLWLRSTLKSIGPKSILSFGELWNNFVLLALLGTGLKVFVSDRCQPDKSLGKFHDSLRRFLYPKATGIICQTETAKSIFQKTIRSKNFIVIGNPIHFIELDAEAHKENVVLTVGRLIASKHHDELIEIFASIRASNWKLVIVGDDALKQKNMLKLQALIDKLEMNNQIDLAGKRNNVSKYYNEAKIFAFTSSSEGFPNVIGEAMSAGLPVIAYDCIAGPRDLIDHEKTGYLVPTHNTEEFKMHLESLINNSELRKTLGEEGQRKIQSNNAKNIGELFFQAIVE